MTTPYEVPTLLNHQSSYDDITLGILSIVETQRRVGEDCIEAARRILIHEALRRGRGYQREAAKVLGISARAMNYLCSQFQLRPIDRRSNEL